MGTARPERSSILDNQTSLFVTLTHTQAPIGGLRHRAALPPLREAPRDRLARSGARRVDTVVRVTRRRLYAKVTDDGHGPAAGSAEALRSLTDRIDDLGGRTRVTRGTPTGTLLEIHLRLRRHP